MKKISEFFFAKNGNNEASKLFFMMYFLLDWHLILLFVNKKNYTFFIKFFLKKN